MVVMEGEVRARGGNMDLAVELPVSIRSPAPEVGAWSGHQAHIHTCHAMPLEAFWSNVPAVENEQGNVARRECVVGGCDG